MRRFCLTTQETDSCLTFGTRTAGVPDIEVEASADGWRLDCDPSEANLVGIDGEGIWVRPSVQTPAVTGRSDRQDIEIYRGQGFLTTVVEISNPTDELKPFVFAEAYDVTVVHDTQATASIDTPAAVVGPFADVAKTGNGLEVVLPITNCSLFTLSVDAGSSATRSSSYASNAFEDPLVSFGSFATRHATR